MKYILDTDAAKQTFMVTVSPTEKTDGNGRVKADRDTGEVLFTTELLVREEGKSQGELIRVTTAGRPEVSEDQRVLPVALEALYWTNTGNDGKLRSGIAYRAKNIMPAPAAGSKSAGADKSEKVADKPVKAVAS